jgi:phenolic acid decarboxylase
MAEQKPSTANSGSVDNEKKIILNASFTCPYCASGAEHYHELFDHGTCVNCGAGLKEFSASITEKGEKEIKNSVLLLYSNEDMARLAQDVVVELQSEGIGVVDVYNIIDGSQTSVVSANLAFVMDKTAGVLVIPSEHLEDNPAIATCFGNALVQKIETSKKLIPVYTTENIKGKIPFGLIDTMGINWDGKVGDRRTLDKDMAFSSIREFVRENSSR